MATTELTLSTTAQDVSVNQSSRPVNYKQEWTQNDTDNHDYYFRGSGKGRLTVCVDILTADETVTCTLYGAHNSAADVGDTGVVSIGSFTITDANDIGYETLADVFPFYIVRVVSAGAATGSPTGTIYINLAAF